MWRGWKKRMTNKSRTLKKMTKYPVKLKITNFFLVDYKVLWCVLLALQWQQWIYVWLYWCNENGLLCNQYHRDRLIMSSIGLPRQHDTTITYCVSLSTRWKESSGRRWKWKIDIAWTCCQSVLVISVSVTELERFRHTKL